MLLIKPADGKATGGRPYPPLKKANDLTLLSAPESHPDIEEAREKNGQHFIVGGDGIKNRF